MISWLVRRFNKPNTITKHRVQRYQYPEHMVEYDKKITECIDELVSTIKFFERLNHVSHMDEYRGKIEDFVQMHKQYYQAHEILKRRINNGISDSKKIKEGETK